MPDLIDPTDNLIADEVGPWATQKHGLLRRYIRLTAGVRKKFNGPSDAGATFTDLFCGTGRAKIRDTEDWIDGSAQVAWVESVQSRSKFTRVHIADLRDEARVACANRLVRVEAPANEVKGNALQAAETLLRSLNPSGLHVFFIDPYSLRSLDFRIFECLCRLQRVDLIVHVSAMDLRRNLDQNLFAADSDFDYFCPGWRAVIDVKASQKEIRSQIIAYWRTKIESLGIGPSAEMKLIKNTVDKPLYWLLIVARHELARKLWKFAANPEQQRSLL